MPELPAEIFKAYDIRGVVGKTLTPPVVRSIGQALGSLALDRGRDTIVVARDGRLSGPELCRALAEGIQSSGTNVIDIGAVTTPMSYFAADELSTQCSVVVTGSHNPPDYNGLKMVIAGDTLAGEDIQALKTRIEAGKLRTGSGSYRRADVSGAYLDRIAGDITLARPIKLAVDCGNGVAGAFAPQLFCRLGCEVTGLFCDVDGTFPNHHPDPSKPQNLQDLIRCLETTDNELGFAFDGDGDRLGVVTRSGAVIYDVKSTRNLKPWIIRHGGTPLLWKTGHSLIKRKMKETGALLAGEMSGHTFFKERWYGFDDGLYAGARLLEILSRHGDPSALLNALPDSLSTPEINVTSDGESPHALIDRLAATAEFPGAAEVIRIDGLRVEYADGFGLARASNTTPVVVFRFEADNEAALKRIQAEFRRVLAVGAPGLTLPF